MVVHTADSTKRAATGEQRRKEIAESLLTTIPQSYGAASLQVGYAHESGLNFVLNRDDPAPFLRKYGGELATEERIAKIVEAFQAYRRGPGGRIRESSRSRHHT